MARLTIDDRGMRLTLTRLERVFGLHADLEVPADRIVDVQLVPNAWPHIHGIRWPGLGIPDLVCVGTLRHAGARDFTAVYGRGPARIVTLDGADYRRVIVTERTDA